MAFTQQETQELYHRRARNYDLTANLYYLLGFREWAYRQQAVQALQLSPGDTVVEIGCGTGLNFSLLHEAVGNRGKIIGVDLTPEMLQQAARRVERHQWSNVELVPMDATRYEYPSRVDGVLSTFAITLIPEYDQVIRQGAQALSKNKHFVILDLKFPENWPTWLVQLFVAISRPFGVTEDLADRHPWESIRRYLTEVDFRELYFGGVYLCVGTAISA